MFVFFSTVCSGAVVVTVSPKVEAQKGDRAMLDCSYTMSSSSSNIIVEWYIVSNF